MERIIYKNNNPIEVNSMKQALFIVDHFPPSFAPRMGYLAKYLKTLGWSAQVFSIRHPSKINKFDNLVGYVEAEEVAMPTYSQHHGANRLIIEIGGRFLGGCTWSIYDQKMYKYIMKSIADKKFDIVVCSTASFFPMNCAYKVSQKLNIPIVLDFRDIYEQDPYVYSTKGLGGLLRKAQIKQRNKLIGKSYATTTISEWHREYLSQHNANTHLIYNGFDEELFSPRSEERTSQFTITYTGSVAPTDCVGSRDPELFFQAIQHLHTENKIEPETFCINFYTDNVSRIYLAKTAARYNIEDYVHIYDWVSAAEIPNILAHSNVLLILVAAQNTHGVMTTKLYEYMAMKRQVLCVPEKDGPIGKIIAQSKSGYTFDNEADIKNYLEESYNKWKVLGWLPCNADWQYVKQFSRELQAKQFVEIFDKAISQS